MSYTEGNWSIPSRHVFTFHVCITCLYFVCLTKPFLYFLPPGTAPTEEVKPQPPPQEQPLQQQPQQKEESAPPPPQEEVKKAEQPQPPPPQPQPEVSFPKVVLLGLPMQDTIMNNVAIKPNVSSTY